MIYFVLNTLRLYLLIMFTYRVLFFVRKTLNSLFKWNIVILQNSSHSVSSTYNMTHSIHLEEVLEKGSSYFILNVLVCNERMV